MNEEEQRLAQSRQEADWKTWGPYLSERTWGTVREDYSADGSAWTYFPHDHARSRAYRWNEDGLLGISDRRQILCFALALWNGKDPILKERVFGLSGPEGNHGEDVKDYSYFLDSTPTHSYMKALYKYPHAAFPYAWLVEENRRRGRTDAEFELMDTGVFAQNQYFDVQVEYAKAAPEDLLVRITAVNRAGSGAAELTVIPTLWFRNTWSWASGAKKPTLRMEAADIVASHEELGQYALGFDDGTAGGKPEVVFTENETNSLRLFGSANASPYVKDAFHRYIVSAEQTAVNPARVGTKAGVCYRMKVPAGGQWTARLR